MKIIVTANKVPFMPGGADYHIRGLVNALGECGHQVELLQFPFRFSPEVEVSRLMEFCEDTDLNMPNGMSVDKVISLQFPAYGVQHDDHRSWVMHQHRSVYELYADMPQSAELDELRRQILQFDNRVLARTQKLFANSMRVAERLQQFNSLQAEPLYHPPHGAGHFFSEEPYDYVFFPSRLEKLKRQDLVIEAAQHLRSGVRILLGGDGGQKPYYQQLIARLGVQDRVQLIGRFSETEKRVLYARCLAVLFVPRDEDYGYVTLEAMLSGKPVITCDDSGGPLEFVQHDETGLIVDSDPQQLAAAIDQLADNRARSRDMGEAGRAAYHSADISWQHVVERLLSS